MEKNESIIRKNDLTQGSILSKLILFALPLIASTLVMQLYNVVDSIVIGQAQGDHGIAAVGMSFPIMMLFNALFIGVSMGANVVISQMFGARDMQSVQRAVNTSVFLSLVIGSMITVIGLVMTRPILRLLSTPAEIIDDAALYLLIIFGGTLGSVGFNVLSGALRGMGESRWPLYAMITTTLFNIVFDTLFTIVMGMGVAGVAIATFLSYFLSAIILLFRINTGVYGVRIVPRQIFKPDYVTIRRILRYGIPTGVQTVAMSLGATINQAFSNNFGANFIAANSILMRTDGFAILPLMGIGMAMTTFSGQNMGAGKTERTRKGIYISLATVLTVSLSLGVLMWFAGESIMRLFNVSDTVLTIGVRGVRVICFFYTFMGAQHCVSGAMRGAGAVIPPFLTSTAAVCVRLLVTYAIAIVPLNRAIQAAVDNGLYASFELAKAAGVGIDGYASMFYSMGIGMVCGAAFDFLYFKFGHWQNKGIVQSKETAASSPALAPVEK
jgi:putative MATE family efflux protein